MESCSDAEKEILRRTEELIWRRQHARYLRDWANTREQRVHDFRRVYGDASPVVYANSAVLEIIVEQANAESARADLCKAKDTPPSSEWITAADVTSTWPSSEQAVDGRNRRLRGVCDKWVEKNRAALNTRANWQQDLSAPNKPFQMLSFDMHDVGWSRREEGEFTHTQVIDGLNAAAERTGAPWRVDNYECDRKSISVRATLMK